MINSVFRISKKYFLLRKVINIIKKINPHLGLKDSDIILGAFPKSGSTWFRFILNNIISIQELDNTEIDYKMINGPLRASYDSNDYPKIKYKSIPRFVATHRKFESKRFLDYRKVYLYRNPGDTMVSFYEYRKALRGNDQYIDAFSKFIREPEFGIISWCTHYLSWIDRADSIVTYESLKGNGLHAMQRVFMELELPIIYDNIFKNALERSDFSNISKMEDKKGLDETAKKHLIPGFKFARKGKVGEWKIYFSNNDIEYMQKILDDYGIILNFKK